MGRFLQESPASRRGHAKSSVDSTNPWRFRGPLWYVRSALQLASLRGKFDDWEDITAIAMDVLDHGTNYDLLRELKAIRARKYESGLLLVNKMRREYLHSSGRIKEHVSTGKLTPAQPVLEATSAIAS